MLDHFDSHFLVSMKKNSSQHELALSFSKAEILRFGRIRMCEEVATESLRQKPACDGTKVLLLRTDMTQRIASYLFFFWQNSLKRRRGKFLQ